MRFHHRCSAVFPAVLAAALCIHPAAARPGPARLATLGDSMTDEYSEQDYGILAKSWTQILVDTGRIDMGPTAAQAGVGYWGEPRRTGYRDNWARYGYRTDSTVMQGFQLGAASSVTVNGAEYVVIFIGINDFAGWNLAAYDPAYSGAWSPEQADQYADSVVANLRTMMDALDATGAKVVLTSPLDSNFSGFARNNHPSTDGRDRVTAMVRRCRDGARALALQKRAVFLDLFRLNIDLFGPNDGYRSQLLVGNSPIQMQGYGATADLAFIPDGVHTQRVIQSIWGEAIITALNAGFNAGVPDMTERDMLAAGNLPYGGADTLAAALPPLRSYVQNFACPADYNIDGAVSVQDIFDFLHDYFRADVRSDMDGNLVTNLGDIFAFLADYFTGCP